MMKTKMDYLTQDLHIITNDVIFNVVYFWIIDKIINTLV